MGGVFNHINGNLYHYAGNNPVRYVDPDGKCLWLALTLAVGMAFLLSSDKVPVPEPVDADTINKKLANIFYDDPMKSVGTILKSPYTRENSESLVIKSNFFVSFCLRTS